jgi:subtilase family serine protease
VWKEPDYQKGVVPNSLANANPGDRGPGRVVPDIAANADPYTGFLIGFSTDAGSGPVYSEGSIGGTSLACPTIAGIMAVAQQRGGGSAIGFANPLLYSLNASAFHDVQAPTTADQKALVYYSAAAQVTRLVTTNHDSSLNTSAGYDNVTGRGSPSSSFITAVGNAG